MVRDGEVHEDMMELGGDMELQVQRK